MISRRIVDGEARVKFEETRRRLDEGIEQTRKFHDTYGFDRTFQMYLDSIRRAGISHEYAGFVDDALKLYNQGLTLAKEKEDKENVREFFHHLARLSSMSGDYSRARAYYMSLENVSEHLHVPPEYGTNDTEKAFQCAMLSLDSVSKDDDSETIFQACYRAECFKIMGMVLPKRAEWKRTDFYKISEVLRERHGERDWYYPKEHFNKALEVYNNIEPKPFLELARCHDSFGKYLRHIGSIEAGEQFQTADRFMSATTIEAS